MSPNRAAIALVATLICGTCGAAERLVTNTRDAGPGSLRQALIDANRTPGPDQIRFDSVKGPFGKPRRIALKSDLPTITDELEIDGYIEDRLWEESGVTLDGKGRFRVFQVGSGVRVRLRHLNVIGGAALQGGGLASAGLTEVDSMSFFGNQADVGGGVAQLGGTLWLINSTLWNNHARSRGGGLAVVAGDAILVHSTLTANRAPVGAGLHTQGHLSVANTIIANSLEGADCASTQALDTRSTHNLIMRSEGCGVAFRSGDPRLGEPGMYNGPTLTIPIQGGSPAINWADNAAAVDARGAPLTWDQRGNGDPRFVAGLADIGAFEEQAVTLLEVDVRDDVDVRGCSSLSGDCSLRGAIAIANASSRHDAITFRPGVFGPASSIELAGPLPQITKRLSLTAGKNQTVRITGTANWVSTAPGVELELRGVVLPESKP